MIEALKTKHADEIRLLQEDNEAATKKMRDEFEIEEEQKRMAAENRERQLQDEAFNLKFQCERLRHKCKMLEDVLQKDSDEKLQVNFEIKRVLLDNEFM